MPTRPPRNVLKRDVLTELEEEDFAGFMVPTRPQRDAVTMDVLTEL